MKKQLFLLLVIALTASTSVLANGLGGYASYWQAKEADDGAYGVGAKLRLDILPILSIEGRGNYFPGFKYNEFLDVDVQNAEGVVTVNLPTDTVDLYVGGGAGYYWFEGTGKEGASDPSIDNKVGIFGLGGINIKIASGFVLFVEVKYTWVDATIDETWEHAKNEEEGKLDGPGGNLGLMLAW